MIELLVVTKNLEKFKEILAILKINQIELKTLKDFPEIEIIESGNTFFENAYIKAEKAAKTFKIMALGEDSGLTVDALSGMPGIYSRRFAGENATDEMNNYLLLEKIKNVPFSKRTAHFISSVVIMDPKGRFISAEGRLDGYIIERPRGDNGFGYDPVFYVPEKNKTLAEMSDHEKNAISHRRMALEKIKLLFVEFIKND